jgi:hypothetical protein
MADTPDVKLVSLYKDYLIYDESSIEFLKKYYDLEESKDKLQKLNEFYYDYAEIFPSYALIL